MSDVLFDLSLPTFHRFAARWDYAVHAHQLATDGAAADPGAQRAKWSKIGLLRDALTKYPLALWLDADVLLVRTDEDISRHLHPDAFQALAIEHVPHEHRVNPNTGVWLMRSSPMAFDFLDAVEAAGVQPGPWADQGAVLAALGWNRGDDRYRWAGPGRGNHFTDATSWLPPSWNQPHVTGRLDADGFNSEARSYADRPVVGSPHAVHFMGLTPAARYRQMAEALHRICANEPPLPYRRAHLVNPSAERERARLLVGHGLFTRHSLNGGVF